MDLRTLPDGMTPKERIDERRKRIENELDVDLSHLTIEEEKIGQSEEKNCEQMFGAVPIPVGYAGPLRVHFSSGEISEVHLPLATTEGALIASVNRGCKAVWKTGVYTSSRYHGMSRSIAFKTSNAILLQKEIQENIDQLKTVAESTSSHLKILRHEMDIKDDHLFLTLFGDTDEAMGMNMVTIAAQAVGNFIAEKFDATLITVAGNVDSDKKPSVRTHDRGRGYEVTASAEIDRETIEGVLKTTPEKLLEVAHAKLEIGSEIAGAIGKNLHAANIIAALYLATGQDAAHTVEGSLADTTIEAAGDGIRTSVRLPAILIGTIGGGTTLPAQSQCLSMLLKPKTSLHRSAQLAESIGAAVLAGEVSLLAAQASQSLAASHQKLGR